MRIYNSDGSEPEMCGNGIRCFAQFLQDLGEDAETYRINTLAGPIIPVMNSDGTITVDMGEPILDGPTVPATLTPNSEHNSVLEQTHTCNGKEWKISMVSMGNPHAIIFVDDLVKDIDFESDGPALESDVSAFPAKTNVEFVQVMSPNHLKMKVWERGAGPTLAWKVRVSIVFYRLSFVFIYEDLSDLSASLEPKLCLYLIAFAIPYVLTLLQSSLFSSS